MRLLRQLLMAELNGMVFDALVSPCCLPWHEGSNTSYCEVAAAPQRVVRIIKGTFLTANR